MRFRVDGVHIRRSARTEKKADAQLYLLRPIAQAKAKARGDLHPITYIDAVERLRSELREKSDNVDDAHDATSAIAFDAANLVWSFLVLCEHEDARGSRQIRNAVAESIIRTLQQNGVSSERLNLEGSDL